MAQQWCRSEQVTKIVMIIILACIERVFPYIGTQYFDKQLTLCRSSKHIVSDSHNSLRSSVATDSSEII